MFEGILDVGAQDIRKVSTTRQHKLGTLGRASRGRLYRYAKAGAVDLAAGKLTIAAAAVANHQNCAVAAAAAVGVTSVSVTLGATAATADQYAGGTMTVRDSTGAGVQYGVRGNTAGASGGTITVFLETSEPIVVALTTSSKVDLCASKYDSVVVSASAVAAFAVGVPNVVIPASNFGWIQVKGRASVLSDGIITKGAGAIISDAVNGAVEIEVAGTVTQRVGTAIEATVDTKYTDLQLELD